MTEPSRRWDEVAWVCALALILIAVVTANTVAIRALHATPPYGAAELSITIALRESAALAAVWFAAARYLHAGAADLGLTRPRLRDVAIGTAAGIACLLVISPLVAAVFHERSNFMTVALLHGTPLARLGVLAVVGVYSPFVQEVVFRGVLLTALLQRTNATLAVVVSSAVFGLVHAGAGPAWVLNAFLIGLVQGALYARLRSLTAAIVSHVVVNATAVVLYVLALAHAGR